MGSVSRLRYPKKWGEKVQRMGAISVHQTIRYRWYFMTRIIVTVTEYFITSSFHYLLWTPATLYSVDIHFFRTVYPLRTGRTQHISADKHTTCLTQTTLVRTWDLLRSTATHVCTRTRNTIWAYDLSHPYCWLLVLYHPFSPRVHRSLHPHCHTHTDTTGHSCSDATALMTKIARTQVIPVKLAANISR